MSGWKGYTYKCRWSDGLGFVSNSGREIGCGATGGQEVLGKIGKGWGGHVPFITSVGLDGH